MAIYRDLASGIDSTSPAALVHGGFYWTHSPRLSGQKGVGVGIVSPQNSFKVISSPPSPLLKLTVLVYFLQVV